MTFSNLPEQLQVLTAPDLKHYLAPYLDVFINTPRLMTQMILLPPAFVRYTHPDGSEYNPLHLDRLFFGHAPVQVKLTVRGEVSLFWESLTDAPHIVTPEVHFEAL